MRILRAVAIITIFIGIGLVLVGCFYPVPGDYLTTSSYYDGLTLSNGRVYSKIDEYVGGDAYNYIIGAALVGNQISGAMTVKAIFKAVGALIFCMGVLVCGFTAVRLEMSSASDGSYKIEDPMTYEEMAESEVEYEREASVSKKEPTKKKVEFFNK